jgi:hypothetical protein
VRNLYLYVYLYLHLSLQVDPRAYDMVATEDFHMSIINAALEVVAAAALPVSLAWSM